MDITLDGFIDQNTNNINSIVYSVKSYSIEYNVLNLDLDKLVILDLSTAFDIFVNLTMIFSAPHWFA